MTKLRTNLERLFELVRIAFIVWLGLFLVFPEMMPEEGSTEAGVPATPTLAVSPSGTLSITAEVGTFRTVTQELSVTTTNYTGYSLILETLGASTDLVHTENAALTIPTIDLPSGRTSITSSEMENEYGFSLDGATYFPVPELEDSALLRTTNIANATAEVTNLTFGVGLTSQKPAGTYVNQFRISAVANESTYQVTYEANAGEDTVTDMPTPLTQTGSVSGVELYLDSAIPKRSGYDFLGWSVDQNETEPEIPRNNLVYLLDPETTNQITLYAIWAENVCEAGYICYNGNGDDGTGTMPDQAVNSNSRVTLVASNFSRTGYGLAGWNTEPDGSGTQYGQGQTIQIGDVSGGGLKLYARWIQSEGILQNWTGCSSMSVGDATALTDFRDGQTYFVAKLADGKCWTSENLRFDPRAALLSKANTNNPTDAFLDTAGLSTSTTSLCSTDTEACINKVAYNLNNLDRNLTQSPTNNDNSSAWYSYGAMYNWFTATAGNGTYSTASGSTNGDICPAGWRIPTGGQNSDLSALNAAVNNGVTSNDTGLKTYPVNYYYSGDWNTNAPTGRGTQGRLWSRTAASTAKVYRLGWSPSTATALTNTWNKTVGFPVRCIVKTDNPSATGSIHYDANGGTGTMADDTGVNLYTAAAKANSFTFEGYTFSQWNTAADGSGTVVENGDMVAEAAKDLELGTGDTLTLYAIWGQEVTLNYDANGGTGAPDATMIIADSSPYTFTITSVSPSKTDHVFVGWATSSSATSAEYVAGDTFTTTNTNNTLYAIWRATDCNAGQICYFGNGADEGTSLVHEVASGGSSVTLFPSDFSRSGYGFLGWNTREDGTGTTYGAMGTMPVGDLSEEGTIVYAKWQASEGNMQEFTRCSSMSIGDVTALTDVRDNNTYAIAKLGDGNCWMMENLRLNPATANLTASNTNLPTSNFLTGAPSSSSANAMCKQDNIACVDTISFYANNINRALPAAYNATGNNYSLYSYGVLYNWYAASAGNGTFSMTSGTVAGDICPAGWRLPTGGSGGEVAQLNTAINSGNTNNDAGLRLYPANFIYSGDHNGSTNGGRGTYARYWTATPSSNNNAYRFGIRSGEVTPVKDYNKWDGFAVRCLAK